MGREGRGREDDRPVGVLGAAQEVSVRLLMGTGHHREPWLSREEPTCILSNVAQAGELACPRSPGRELESQFYLCGQGHETTPWEAAAPPAIPVRMRPQGALRGAGS